MINLKNVVLIELASSIAGAIIAAWGVMTYLKAHRKLPGSPDWTSPSWSEMRKTALHMYSSYAITLAYSPQVLTFLVQRYLGMEATAVFGFLRKLYDLVSSYLPAGLLFGLVRPKLVASYTGEGGINILSSNANLIGKISLFVLMPVIVIASNSSELLVNIISGGKFPGSGLFFMGFMLSLIPASQRLILESVAVTVGRSELCSQAALVCVVMLPITYGLLKLDMGLWAPITALAAGNILFNTIILRGLTSTVGYQTDFRGFWKLIGSTLLACLFAYYLLPIPQGKLGLGLSILLTTVIFLLVAYAFKPFSEIERQRINKLLNHHVFIW
jgi:hypothetical protein